jgi:hypothetical protein
MNQLKPAFKDECFQPIDLTKKNCDESTSTECEECELFSYLFLSPSIFCLEKKAKKKRKLHTKLKCEQVDVSCKKIEKYKHREQTQKKEKHRQSGFQRGPQL